jgi:pimeloyl-ACP methyl ester carboxylesterase
VRSAGRWRRVVGRIAFYSAILLVVLPATFAWVITRPARGPIAPVPLGFHEQLLSADGLRLRTWWRPGSGARPAVVVVHGVGDSLESFVDHAWFFARRGHAVALLDTRGHGGSEGNVVTLGGRERADVRAAMEFLRGGGHARAGLLLVGHSMGAVAVLRAAADQPDVRGVIVEAPYDTFRGTITRHARLLYGMPSWFPVVPITIAFAGWRGGFDPDEVSAVAAAARCRGALLAIADGGDDRMPEVVVRRVFDAHAGPKRMWVAPGAPHVGAVLDREYWPRVTAFLDESGL